ncbi:O-antigen ligase family protein [Hellea balneolensis]|uniref:O-antigen ligase family protein n=1 Tax=Hellea balneolensis TaxID=287478 RepID=UPI00042211A6|nr:O-antigen ligase family protein [Hellea balneolensis]
MTPLLDKTSFGAIFLVIVLMPFVSHAGGLGVAPLIFFLGIFGLLLALKTKSFRITGVQLALILFLTWLSITALWSSYRPDDILTNYVKLFLMALVFYWSWPLFEYAGRRRPRRLQHLLMSTSIFGAGLLVIDLLSDFGLTLFFNPANDFNEKIFRIIDAEMNLGHAITILVLLAAPVSMLMLARLPKALAKPAMALFIGLLACATLLNDLSVGLLGLMGVLGAMTLGYFLPRRTPAALLIFAICVIMAAPLMAYFASHYAQNPPGDVPLSWDHRLRMWGYCWNVIIDNPLIGAGFDASRSFDETYIAKDGREIVTVSLHPHNAGVQIWTETGLIGALLASAVIASLIKPVQKFVQSRGHAGAISGVIIATLIISSLTYGAWQFWWWGCVFFAVGTLHLLPASKRPVPIDDAQWIEN